MQDTILNDSGWYGGSSAYNNCIKDYYRHITYSGILTSNDIQEECKRLASEDCPGWTGVEARRVQKNDDNNQTLVKYYTCWDSSD